MYANIYFPLRKPHFFTPPGYAGGARRGRILFIILLHVAFFLCISMPDCQFVYSTLLYRMYHKYWVSKPTLISHCVLRPLFRLAKIILCENDNSISGFLVIVPIQSGSLIN